MMMLNPYFTPYEKLTQMDKRPKCKRKTLNSYKEYKHKSF